MKAIYPGSFDPVHNGHLDLIIRASDLFEHLTVAVYEESNQNVLFSSSERVNLISESILPYKKNVDDHRESPSFELIRLLLEKKAQVDYHDFYIPKLHKTRKYDFDLQSVSLNKISTYDLVILATDHDKYDYEFLQTNAQIIVDTRGRLNNTLTNVISA